MRFAPPVGLFLHVLLKLDPASSLLPAHFMVFVHNQFVQLHKQLRRKREVRENMMIKLVSAVRDTERPV